MWHCSKMSSVDPPLRDKEQFAHAKELEIRAERLQEGAIGGQRTRTKGGCKDRRKESGHKAYTPSKR